MVSAVFLASHYNLDIPVTDHAEFDHVNLIAKTSEGIYPIPQYAQDVNFAFPVFNCDRFDL